MFRIVMMAAVILSAPAFAKASSKSLVFSQATPELSVSDRVAGYAGYLHETAKAFPSTVLATAGGYYADGAAPSAAGSMSIEDKQAEWRNLQANQPDIRGIGLLISGGGMLVAGLIVALALPGALLFALAGIPILGTILLIAGLVIAGVGAILVTFGLIGLISSMGERASHRNKMQTLQKEIEEMKKSQSAPAAPTSGFIKVEPAITVASF